jgi:hypothetical protein
LQIQNHETWQRPLGDSDWVISLQT